MQRWRQKTAQCKSDTASTKIILNVPCRAQHAYRKRKIWLEDREKRQDVAKMFKIYEPHMIFMEVNVQLKNGKGVADENYQIWPKRPEERTEENSRPAVSKWAREASGLALYGDFFSGGDE